MPRPVRGAGIETAVTGFAQAVRHARTDATVGALGPYLATLAPHVGGSGAAVATHAAEDDHPAVGPELLGQVEHHLVDGRGVGFRPGTLAAFQSPIVVETEFVQHRHHHDLAATQRFAVADVLHMPLAVPADCLRQVLLEAGVDVLGIEEADRQAAGQGVEKCLHRRRAAERGRQQPHLAGRFAGLQRHRREVAGNLQARRTLLVEQCAEAVANAIAGVADQALQLADQPPLPARVMFGMPLRCVALAEQHRRTVLLQQAVQQRRVVLLGQVHQPQVGRALQRGVVDPGRVGVEHHLVAMAEQRLLQHVALQRGVGDHRDPWRGALTHAGRPGTGWLRAARFPGKACRGTG